MIANKILVTIFSLFTGYLGIIFLSDGYIFGGLIILFISVVRILVAVFN